MSPVKALTRRRFSQIVADQIQKPFRGEIWEFFQKVPMGRGFSNNGKPFDINTAHYVREPMMEIRRRPYGKFVIKAAVQMLKTNCTIEQPAAYFMANDPGDMTVFFFGDDKAFSRAKGRIMPYIKSQAEIGNIIEKVVSSDPSGKYQITTSEFYLPNMVMRIWPANLASTQGETLRYVLISDAFLSKQSGILKEAIARTTQHNSNELKDYKIVIESQGGEEDDDFDVEWHTTDQRELYVSCPFCSMSQPFVWHRLRPEDFLATPTKDIPSLDHDAWIKHHTPILKSDDRRHAGMKRGNESVKLEEGYDEKEVKRQTYYECFHCGSTWNDKPDIRKLIDQSSKYVPIKPTALYENVGWSWPVWAGQRIPWGDTMLEYLDAKTSQRMGNILPLKIWHQKRAAAVWTPEITQHRIELGSFCYETDPAKMMPDFFGRYMSVDSQKEKEAGPKEPIVGSFWWIIREFDKFGNSRQLDRGFADSWDKWIAKQRFWKVSNQCTVIDAAWMLPQIERRAAAEFALVVPKMANPYNGRKDPYPACWKLFIGSDNSKFRVGKKLSAISEGFPSKPYLVTDMNKKQWRISVFRYWWSNFVFEQQLDTLLNRIEGMPKFEYLPADKTSTPESEKGILTYEQQLSSRYPQQVRGKDRYVDIANRQGHFRDCELMLLARVSQDNLLGHINPQIETVLT